MAGRMWGGFTKGKAERQDGKSLSAHVLPCLSASSGVPVDKDLWHQTARYPHDPRAKLSRHFTIPTSPAPTVPP
jgi:hypothetical protein